MKKLISVGNNDFIISYTETPKKKEDNPKEIDFIGTTAEAEHLPIVSGVRYHQPIYKDGAPTGIATEVYLSKSDIVMLHNAIFILEKQRPVRVVEPDDDLPW